MSLARNAIKVASRLSDRLFPDPKGPRVLIYHQVEAGLGRQMEVRLEDFRRQLEWLGGNREIVSLDDAIGRWGDDGSERLVALTFDDGYGDTYSMAFPLLLDHGFPFTVYLATESIDSGRALGPVPGAEPLNWDEIESMAGSGLMIAGAHTHRHADLRSLSSDEVEEELAISDDLIERRLGTRPKHFAYPWGFWSKSAHQAVASRYESAALAGSARPSFDPLYLRRYPIQLSDSFEFFEARLRGGFRLEEAIRRLRNGYRGP